MRRWLSRLSACALAASVAACVGESAPDSAMTAPLVLDPSVQQAVQATLSGYGPTAMLTAVEIGPVVLTNLLS